METLTWVSLCVQLAALVSVAAAMLLYLLRKGRAPAAPAPQARTVLVTSLDTALGLQIATYLSSRGWRVIGGCVAGGLGARLAGSWASRAAHTELGPPPRLVAVELDAAREDQLEEAARTAAQHLPAGEHGIWAVVNTAGDSGRGGAARWEAALRGNVLAALRVARAFAPLLAAAAADHPSAGRLLYIGLTSDTWRGHMSGAAASAGAAAARWGAWGAACALRGSLRARGVRVVVLHAPDLTAADVYAPPLQIGAQTQSRPETPSSDASSNVSCAVNMPGEVAEYSARVLPPSALKVLEEALTTPTPKESYQLKMKPDSWFSRTPSLTVTV